MRKKLILIFIFSVLFNISYADNFNFEEEITSEIGHNAESISKIDFSGNNFSLIHSSIDFLKNPEEKIKNENKILKKIGKEKIDILLEKNIIQIRGAEFICGEINNMKSQSCVFDDKNEYFLNTKIKKFYKINSDIEKSIDISFFPISPDFYIYDNYEIIEKKIDDKNINSPKITFFHDIYDSYNLNIVNLNDKKNYTNFLKNYKFVKLENGNYIYIPYYTTKIDLKKGENFLKFSYQKHTINNYKNGIEKEKIRFY